MDLTFYEGEGGGWRGVEMRVRGVGKGEGGGLGGDRG